MMTSIFASFDMSMLPSQSPWHSYLYGLLPIFMFTQLMWLTPPTRWSIISTSFSITSTLTKPTQAKFLKGFHPILFSTFYSIMTLNIWSTTPYMMSMTPHLVTTLSVGAPMWLSLMKVGLINKFKSSSAHFLPENTPLTMASFLAMVEGLSSYIRPITLSFRLAANISAGHVILGMMMTSSTSMLLNKTSMFSIFSPMLLGTVYSMFEMLICLVQAFVFTLLSAMYSSDYIHK